MIDTIRISEKGQIIIPIKMRRLLNLKKGQDLTVKLRRQELIIKKLNLR